MILSESIVALPSYMIRNTNSSTPLNASGARLAFGFFVRSSFSLRSVYVYLSAVVGSPTASNIRCAIHDASDPSGLPGLPIVDRPLSSNPVVGVNQFTFNPAVDLDSNKMYWLVLRNTNSSPSSSYVTVLRSVGDISFISWSTGPGASSMATSSDSGSTWTYVPERIHLFVVADINNVRYGWIPVSAAQLNVAAGRLVGYRFTPKVNMTLVGVSVNWAGVSSNTNATLRLEVWDGTGSNLIWYGSTVNAFRFSGRVSTYQSSSSFTLNANQSYIVGIRALSATSSTDNIACRSVDIGNNPLTELGMEVAVHDGSTWQFFSDRAAGLALLMKDLQSSSCLVPGLYRGVW